MHVITQFSRELWQGQFDNDLVKLSAVLPAQYDTLSREMEKA